MRRLPTIVLLAALAVFVPFAGANRARAGEAEPRPTIDPVQVGRLLLSSDAAKRAEGVHLLQERLAQGGNVTAFLERMAAAQAAWADAKTRLRDQEPKGPKVAEPSSALETPAPAAPAGPTPPPPQRASQRAPQAETTGDEETRPEALAAAAEPLRRAPDVNLVWSVLEVPSGEMLGWLAIRGYESDGIQDDALVALAPVERGEAVILHGAGRIALERAKFLPEARAIRDPATCAAPYGVSVELLDGEPVRYRRSVRRAGKAAWAVDSDELRRGLKVGARVEPAADGSLEVVVTVTHVDVPLPMRIERVRPADDVEPLEIDRPEFQTASVTLRAPIALGDKGAVAVVPGVVPDRVVVVGIRLVPLDAPVRATKGVK